MKNNPKWYYEEKTPGVDYLNPEIAQKYDDAHQKFRNFKEESEHIVQVLGITPDDTVMDFGCGTGNVALNLAKYCDKVICIDISRECWIFSKIRLKKEILIILKLILQVF
jgi:ubiquinone/menaquinone biosynthesis C-methylase UbiE